VAGEVSGDAHAAALVRALRRSRPDLRVWAVGGEALRAAGAEVIFPAEELSTLGVWEAAGRLPAVLRARARVLERLDEPPDLFVPVDFGGLNLRLARAARRRGVPVAYYIPPKVWAWGPWRVRSLRASVDEALVILPFEEAFLRDRGVSARYVGSPVLDHLAPCAFPPEADTVGLLPGSRPGEVARIWPLLTEVASTLARTRALRFLVPRAPGISPEALAPAPSSPRLQVEVLEGRSQEVMERSRVCVVASGTATLECALVGTPLVAVYRVHPLTYAAGRLMVRVPFVSLPNLVAGRRVVPEFVQTGPEPVAEAVEALLDEGPRRDAARRGLAEVRASLGERGASERAAEFLLGRFGGGAAA
jgi:lipid-A-disaccharide synthase